MREGERKRVRYGASLIYQLIVVYMRGEVVTVTHRYDGLPSSSHSSLVFTMNQCNGKGLQNSYHCFLYFLFFPSHLPFLSSPPLSHLPSSLQHLTSSYLNDQSGVRVPPTISPWPHPPILLSLYSTGAGNTTHNVLLLLGKSGPSHTHTQAAHTHTHRHRVSVNSRRWSVRVQLVCFASIFRSRLFFSVEGFIHCPSLCFTSVSLFNCHSLLVFPLVIAISFFPLFLIISLSLFLFSFSQVSFLKLL